MSNQHTPRRDPLPAWTEYKDKITAMGYTPLPIERQQVANGHEHPMTGNWIHGAHYELYKPDEYVAGILPARLPRSYYEVDECQRTAVAGIRLTVSSSRETADALEAIVRQHTGAGPARLCYDDESRLLPFRISEDARSFGTYYPKSFWLPTDAPYGKGNCVTVEASGASWLLTGGQYHWRDGDLTVWPRDTLPELTVDTARDIMAACEEYLEGAQIPQEPTAQEVRLQQIRERARERALAHAAVCPGTCVRCMGSKVGDDVLVNGLDWGPVPIVRMDDDGNYFVRHLGKVYSAPADRLTPVPAPAIA